MHQRVMSSEFQEVLTFLRDLVIQNQEFRLRIDRLEQLIERDMVDAAYFERLLEIKLH